MNLKSSTRRVAEILFLFCVLLLTIHFFSKIKISFDDYFLHFWGIYVFSLLIILLTSKRKFYINIIIGLAPIIIFFYQFLNTEHITKLRKSIPNSQYYMIYSLSDYKIMEKHYFIEKEIAKKKSSIFFHPNSKIGIISSFQFEVELIGETKNTIILDINTTRNGKTLDTIQKTLFLNKKND